MRIYIVTEYILLECTYISQIHTIVIHHTPPWHYILTHLHTPSMCVPLLYTVIIVGCGIHLRVL